MLRPLLLPNQFVLIYCILCNVLCSLHKLFPTALKLTGRERREVEDLVHSGLLQQYVQNTAAYFSQHTVMTQMMPTSYSTCFTRTTS